MNRLPKNATLVRQTLRDVREGVASGIDDSRDRAAEMLESAGRAVRTGSRQAGRAAERRGQDIGRTLEWGASAIRSPRSRGLLGYLRRHPVQALLLLGLVTGVVAIALLPRLAQRMEGAYEGNVELGPMA